MAPVAIAMLATAATGFVPSGSDAGAPVNAPGIPMTDPFFAVTGDACEAMLPRAGAEIGPRPVIFC